VNIAQPQDAVPLTGGMMNAPVRLGDVVRRRVNAATPTLHELLCHARERGVDWIPQPLGIDEGGWETLSFLPGTVPHDMPDWVWHERVLVSVASRMRQWHDATAGFPTDRPWAFETGTAFETICHNDFAPYNCVFQDGALTGLIDFDLCAPGSRLWDLSYAAYRFVPLMPSEALEPGDEVSPFAIGDVRRRIARFLEAYAHGEPALRYGSDELLAMTADRLARIADWTADFAASTGNEALRKNAAMYRRHGAWIRRNLPGSNDFL